MNVALLSGRMFEMLRDEDETGVSGTGHVADGIEFDDGKVALHWRGENGSTTIFDSMNAAKKVHGHDGKTRFVFPEEPAIMQALHERLATMDLGVADVHVDGAETPKAPWQPPSEVLQAKLSASQYGDPVSKKFPIHTAESVAKTIDDLDQQRTKMNPSEFNAVRRRVAKAADKFGVKMAKQAPKTGGRIHVRADLAHGGSVHVTHHAMNERGVLLYAPQMPISLESIDG